MCGFAGEFLLREGKADRELARRMAARLVHRGPDEEGSFLSPDGRCAIGFRRLAVIDPALSHQPMTSPDGAATVAFNGEIYNFRQLRAELAADGATFLTAGDTEVLLPLWQRYGPGMLERLEGMFAIALYDHRAGTLFLARDRFGQKPLWYAPLADRIVFASEAKAILLHPLVGKETRRDSLIYYAGFGYIPAPLSAWKGILKLPPASQLLVGERIGEPARYWAPKREELSSRPEELVERVRAELARSVEHHMVSDVPMGVLLSGGLDSSVVTALACRAAGAGGGVRTFTAGFAEAEFDERPSAREVALHCGAEHAELLVEPPPADAIDAIVSMFDEPFGDSSALPTWIICRAARAHATVLLAGDGGDEVFAGYDRYRAMHLAERMHQSTYMAVRLAAWLARPLAPAGEKNRLRRLIRFADSLTYHPTLQYFMLRTLFSADDLERLFTPQFLEETDAEAPCRWFADLYEEGDFPDEVTRAQRHDMLTYLPDDLLVKTDRASMASSAELRAPMLDHRLAALGLGLPLEMKLDSFRGKKALRSAFAGLLPRRTLRGRKRGFGAPISAWLRGTLTGTLRETLLDDGLNSMGIFRRDGLEGLINDHLDGTDDHSHRLWALLVLARWLVSAR